MWCFSELLLSDGLLLNYWYRMKKPQSEREILEAGQGSGGKYKNNNWGDNNTYFTYNIHQHPATPPCIMIFLNNLQDPWACEVFPLYFRDLSSTIVDSTIVQYITYPWLLRYFIIRFVQIKKLESHQLDMRHDEYKIFCARSLCRWSEDPVTVILSWCDSDSASSL